MDLRQQLEHTLGDAYSLERELGGGGMSRVFVATERALGRQVVVKVLPSEMAGQVSVDRFKREISLAAQLQHPHIVPLLTAGDSGGLPYFTMPYVKGESLRARITQTGELPVSEAIRVLREVASALAFAHDAGVVHRDIKPDNVLLSGGSAMVTDFGVAKALSASTTGGGSSLTSLGVALGTPAYMSPEQASADPMVDHRADIYAWGILAYELLTGSTPYSGRPAAAMLAAHTTEAAEPIARRRPGVPPALAALVMRCLEKRAADRPQRAEEIVRALDEMVTPSGGMSPTGVLPAAPARRGVRAAVIAIPAIALFALVGYWALHRNGAPGDAVRSIAVLPFENKNGDSTYNYLADGMSDELRSSLNGIAGLSVKARSSSAPLRGKSASEAGAKLNVAAVLEGSISRSAQRLHVTAELVRVSDENTLWSGSFDKLATELPAVQDSIIRAIRVALRVGDGAKNNASNAAGARGTADVEAYDLFLKGEYFRQRFDIQAALPLLTSAITKDPAFARAHASLALAYATVPFVGGALPDSVHQQAVKSIGRALALAPSLSTTRVAQALLQINDFQYVDAEKSLQKAIALDSANADADARVWHAFSLGYLGRLDDALVEARNAVRIDPLSTQGMILVQAITMYQGQFGESISTAKAVLDIDPRSAIAYGNLSETYALMHQPDSTIKAVETMLKIDPSAFGVRIQAMFGYASAGRWKEADEQGRLAIQDGGSSPDFAKAFIAVINGDLDAALAATERGVRAKEPLFNTLWLHCEPIFAPLRTRPRFVALMQEIGSKVCPPDNRWPIKPRPAESKRP